MATARFQPLLPDHSLPFLMKENIRPRYEMESLQQSMSSARVSDPHPPAARKYQRPIILSDDEDSDDDASSSPSAAAARDEAQAKNLTYKALQPRPQPQSSNARTAAPPTSQPGSRPTYSFPEPTKTKMQFNPNLSAGSNGRGVVDLTSSPLASSGQNGINNGKTQSNSYAFANPPGNGSYSGAFGSSLPTGSSPFKKAQADAAAKDRARTNMGYNGYPTSRPIGLQHPSDARIGVPIAPPTANRFDHPANHPHHRSGDAGPEEGEDFNSALHAITASASAGDYDRVSSTEADAHMRDLLESAMGDGEDAEMNGDIKDEEYTVEGFAKGMRLMPHQVRGVRWMRGRETGRNYGGILADDMGLGKTVQTLARIVEGKATTAERKAGFTGGTLIIAPLAVMEQWASECKTKTRPGTLKVTTHHGPSRAKSAKALTDYDVVITTYQIVSSELTAYQKTAKTRLGGSDSDASSDSDNPRFGKSVKGKGKGAKKADGYAALFGVKWLRIVVDEAQNIKNRNTQQAKATTALEAKYRWCLTGTPIQNSVEELYSLFRFLRAKPLDQWEVFRDRIARPVKEGRTKFAMKRLHVVLKAVMLRRTKDATIDGKPILNLPARVIQVVKCELDPSEREFYDALEKRQNLSLNKYLAAGTVMSNYTHMLVMLLRMRQACCHPALVTTSSEVDKDAIESRPAPQEEEETDDLAAMLGGLGVDGTNTTKCDICFAVLEDNTSKYCDDCATISRKARERTVDSTNGSSGLPESSSKIKTMLRLLGDIKERSDGAEKTIVFSQFTSFLNLLEPFLKRERVAYVRYDGSMRNDKRQAALAAIKDDPKIKVILISFKAGSTGLNLTSCNNVILLDLWWNPALEDQAFDRAHRLGQKLDVNIYKVTVTDSVEDRILALQEDKRDLANAALSGQALNAGRLDLNQMMDLFRRDHRAESVDRDYRPQTKLRPI